jgi:hypothetical protein
MNQNRRCGVELELLEHLRHRRGHLAIVLSIYYAMFYVLRRSTQFLLPRHHAKRIMLNNEKMLIRFIRFIHSLRAPTRKVQSFKQGSMFNDRETTIQACQDANAK